MLRTSVCDVLGIAHPVVMAPVGYGSNPALVAAVSNAGGLGILACTWLSIDTCVNAIREIKALTDRPFGVNFVLHLADSALIDACLAEGVPVLSTFRGNPANAIAKAKAAGSKSMHQVTTLPEAEEAVRLGVDVIVAQGREAGGHMGPIPLWTLLPEVVKAASGRPVMATGGIIDGVGLAAALCLGAAGAMMGTRFLASTESSATDKHKAAIVASQFGDTVDTGIWDLLWGEVWPGVKVRALRNDFVVRWHGHEDDLSAQLEAVRADYRVAIEADDATRLPLLAGEGAARIRDILPAADIVGNIVADAERSLLDAARSVR